MYFCSEQQGKKQCGLNQWQDNLSATRFQGVVTQEPHDVSRHKMTARPVLKVTSGTAIPTICYDPALRHLYQSIVTPCPAGKPKPIITRFKNRLDRAVVLRLKKQFAPKDATNRNRQRFPIYEDLTKDNFHLLKKLSKD